jgi:hypothetical protein
LEPCAVFGVHRTTLYIKRPRMDSYDDLVNTWSAHRGSPCMCVLTSTRVAEIHSLHTAHTHTRARLPRHIRKGGVTEMVGSQAATWLVNENKALWNSIVAHDISALWIMCLRLVGPCRPRKLLKHTKNHQLVHVCLDHPHDFEVFLLPAFHPCTRTPETLGLDGVAYQPKTLGSEKQLPSLSPARRGKWRAPV